MKSSLLISVKSLTSPLLKKVNDTGIIQRPLSLSLKDMETLREKGAKTFDLYIIFNDIYMISITFNFAVNMSEM